jgi:L-alanine-DL-glutamate epimerase-like enolase superfamily enzyme
MTIKVERIEAIPLSIPFDHWAPPPVFGGRPRTSMDALYVRLTASGGIVGWGEAFWGGWQATAAVLEHAVAPLALGQDAADAALPARLERALHNMGRSGPLMNALSALDIALWDVRGKLAGRPVHALLGGRKRGRLAVYASLLRYGGVIEHVRRNVARALERKYRQIKLHETAAEAVAATRVVTGPDIPIMVDTNCAWSGDAAVAAVRAIAPSKPLWVEEPVWPPEDFEALAQVRRTTGVALAAGENASSALDFRRMIAAGAVDYVQPSAIKIGGITALSLACRMCPISVRAILRRYMCSPRRSVRARWSASSATSRSCPMRRACRSSTASLMCQTVQVSAPTPSRS